jgi:hypothetical protein
MLRRREKLSPPGIKPWLLSCPACGLVSRVVYNDDDDDDDADCWVEYCIVSFLKRRG